MVVLGLYKDIRIESNGVIIHVYGRNDYYLHSVYANIPNLKTKVNKRLRQDIGVFITYRSTTNSTTNNAGKYIVIPNTQLPYFNGCDKFILEISYIEHDVTLC